MCESLFRSFFSKVLLLGTAILTGAAQATNPVAEVVVVDEAPGTLALGVGMRWGDSPYVNIDDIGSVESEQQYDLLPYYYYEGEFLFAHGTDAGLHLYRDDTFSLDALVAYRFDRLQPEQDDYYRTVNEREQGMDAGLRAQVRGDWGQLRLTWLKDAMDHHDGEEYDLSYRFIWQDKRWTVSPFASYVHWDKSLSDYYYGVTDAEARDDLPTYRPGASTSWRTGLNTTYKLTERLSLIANVGVDWLDDVAADSPLVEQDLVPSAMLGMTYYFGNLATGSHTPAGRNDEGGDWEGEWSWRFNVGYTAEQTFHKMHRGELEQNSDVHSYLTGLTLGKLALDGKRLDVWGKVSLNRRLERDYQDDFWEINPYIMVMGTGYSPWSNREIFRYGLGYGFSYSDKIPYIEQVKQTGENSSHFLNYMEAQLDVPLRNLFGHRGWWQNCYSGMTLVHRSGVFSRVDLIGNVSGGSDVVSAHLECKR